MYIHINSRDLAHSNWCIIALAEGGQVDPTSWPTHTFGTTATRTCSEHSQVEGTKIMSENAFEAVPPQTQRLKTANGATLQCMGRSEDQAAPKAGCETVWLARHPCFHSPAPSMIYSRLAKTLYTVSLLLTTHPLHIHPHTLLTCNKPHFTVNS